VRGRPDEYNVVAFYMQDSRILAAVAINRGKDILRAMSLIKAGLQVDTGKLRDENIDLRSLLPGARPIRPPHIESYPSWWHVPTRGRNDRQVLLRQRAIAISALGVYYFDGLIFRFSGSLV
jgi:Reductase C-terminal